MGDKTTKRLHTVDLSRAFHSWLPCKIQSKLAKLAGLVEWAWKTITAPRLALNSWHPSQIHQIKPKLTHRDRPGWLGWLVGGKTISAPLNAGYRLFSPILTGLQPTFQKNWPNDKLYCGIARDSISWARQSIQHIKTVAKKGPVGINKRARRHKMKGPVGIRKGPQA